MSQAIGRPRSPSPSPIRQVPLGRQQKQSYGSSSNSGERWRRSPPTKRARRSPSPVRRRRHSPSPEEWRRYKYRSSYRADDNRESSSRRQEGRADSILPPQEKRRRKEHEDSTPKSQGSEKRAMQATNPIGRTGGIYIPPFKLAMMKRPPAEKNSEEFQKQYWEALRKSINGYVNKASTSNIPNLIEEMFNENLIRARGLVARAILRAQLASPGFTHVFAALLAVINSKLPEIGQLLITRLVLQFRRAYKRNDKIVCVACLKFIAHLVNQKVLAEVTALEICTLLLEKPTNDSVEVCCSFLQECGQVMSDSQPKAVNYIFERLRSILNEGEVDNRTQYTIEKLFDTRKKHFADFPGVPPELDLIEEDDQQTHTIDLLNDSLKKQELLDIFQPVPPDQFEMEEKKWKEIARDILGQESSASDEAGDASSDSSVDSEAEAEERQKSLTAEEAVRGTQLTIMDCTEQDLINLRKTVYLCIMSSASFEECVHKLLKLHIPEGQEIEVCTMLIDCCSMERTFSRFFALQGERLCKLKEAFRDAFVTCFKRQYASIHRLETNKLRNIAKFFAHLFATDAIPWSCMEILVLTESATTAASRIFIKIIFQDLADELGLETLQQRLREEELQPYMSASLFPRDSVANIRFSINFFTAIGLGALADDLRACLSAGKTKINGVGATSTASCRTKCRVVCEPRCGPMEEEEVEESESSSLSDSGSMSLGESSFSESSSFSISISGSPSDSSESECSFEEEECLQAKRRCRVVCQTVCPPMNETQGQRICSSSTHHSRKRSEHTSSHHHSHATSTTGGGHHSGHHSATCKAERRTSTRLT
eukprot:Gregarina_sp_Poly_1__3065@NODE_1861_length_3183_cov_48_838896_g1206_i0_p1_GENE_NODE_1861_length_3183_cov_48_838896_g1206_i0NODE_1861_length_3183_cov_48_838896_g1206_i0_p1_ORF_typecomplete_len901_score135_94MIF4G/PF02854_19/4_7e33MIF4G/PF02854_19/0_0061MA3/PF02847_17/3_9e03MA3/PF02847_17/7_1e27TFCD_C/PF12612_8/0_29TFCD_C/PF12612_8/3e03ParcG/PF10274_9/0_36MIF4G_like/PF09088_11/6_6e03MIF4G_like/PF09088_11/3_9_NODE_1861_length_3183_cov_48_838896_g1206_i04812961